MTEALALLRLNAVPGLRTGLVGRWVGHWGSAAHVLDLGPEELSQDGAVGLETARRFLDHARRFPADKEMERVLALGVRLVASNDPEYPRLLGEISDPPLLLYVKGALPEVPAIAIVGSRRPTPYGCRMARKLSGGLASAGICVASGLARGIDTESHAAALKAGGLTWAVLGCGLARVYPPENARLAGEIALKGGALVSEFPLDAEPLAAHFPRRNRILAGLSLGTLVVEGDLKSGALITARLAIQEGREVFAVPGPADSPLSEGPHSLLRQGAALAERPEDVVETVLPNLNLAKAGQPAAAPAEAGGEARRILELIGSESRTVDELSQASGLAVSRVAAVLSEMEMKDWVASAHGQRYARK